MNISMFVDTQLINIPTYVISLNCDHNPKCFKNAFIRSMEIGKLRHSDNIQS